MPQRCTVCAHEAAFEINERIVMGKESNRAIACQYDLNRESVRRHREHIPELLREASRNTDVFETETILLRIEDLERETLEQLEALKKSKRPDRRTILTAIREQRENIRLVAQVRQIIDKAPQTVLIAPQVREVIVQALMPYPEARQELSRRLELLEGGKR